MQGDPIMFLKLHSEKMKWKNPQMWLVAVSGKMAMGSYFFAVYIQIPSFTSVSYL